MIQLIAILVGLSIGLGVLYALWRSQWALLPVVLMFPAEQLLQVYIPQLLAMGPLVNVLVAAIVASALITKVGRGEPLAFGAFNGVSLPIFILFVQTFASTTWSPVSESTFGLIRYGLPYTLLMVAAAPLLVSRIDQLSRLLVGLMLLGLLVVVLILINPSAKFYSGRLVLQLGDTGAMGNPLATSELGGMIAIIAALVHVRKGSRVLTLVRVSAFFAGLGIAVASGSRGQVYATLAAILLTFPLARKLKNPSQFFVTTAGAGVFAMVAMTVVRFFVTDKNASRWSLDLALAGVSDRMVRVNTLMEAYLDAPGSWFQGLGFNAFTAVWGQSSYVHNLPVEVLCEQGLLGFTMLMIAFVSVVRAAWRLMSMEAEDPTGRATVAILIAMMLFHGILSLKQGAYYGGSSLFMFMLLTKRLELIERSRLGWSVATPVWDIDEARAYGEPATSG